MFYAAQWKRIHFRFKQRVNPPACEKSGSRSPSTLRTGRGTVIHCLLTFAQHDDDTDKRHSETHADANQLDHIHCANRFEPRRHTDQIDGTERHA